MFEHGVEENQINRPLAYDAGVIPGHNVLNIDAIRLGLESRQALTDGGYAFRREGFLQQGFRQNMAGEQVSSRY